MQISNTKKFKHEPDSAKLLQRAANLSGFGYNEEFKKYLGIPSQYLTDFFGVLALKDITIQDLVVDFSGLAKLELINEYTVAIDFGNFCCTFYCDCAMVFRNICVPIDHCEFDYPTYTQCHEAMESFFGILKQLGLINKYLRRNPFYVQEVLTAFQLANVNTSVRVQSDDGKSFIRYPDSLLIFPDPVHGIGNRVKELLDFVRENQFDYLALEMLHIDMQPILNRFFSVGTDCEEYQNIIDELSDYFSTSWKINDTVFKSKQDNYFVQTIMLCRQKNIRLIAIEPSDLSYVLFRAGETDFGGAVRSCIWSECLPEKGKIVIFGGAAHFSSKLAYNLQDFYHNKNAQSEIFILDR